VAITDLMNGGTISKLPTTKEEGVAAACLRVLFYFFSPSGQGFPKFEEILNENPELAKPNIVAEIIAASQPDNKTMIHFIFVIDEFQALTEDGKNREEEPLYFFLHGFDYFFLGISLALNRFWLQPILAGTKHPEYLKDHDPTLASYHSLKMSLFSHREIFQLLDKYGELLKGAAYDRNNWRTNLTFLFHLTTIGTIPRGLTIFLRGILGPDMKNSNFFDIGNRFDSEGSFSMAMGTMTSLYPFLASIPENEKESVRIGLLYAITNFKVQKSHELVLERLEKKALLLLQVEKDPMGLHIWRCAMPLYFIRLASIGNNDMFPGFPDILSYLNLDADKLGWKNWETFNARYLAFRIMALYYLDLKQVTLGQLFEGAWGLPATKNILVSTKPKLSVISSAHQLYGIKLLEEVMDADTLMKIDPKEGNHVIQNAEGAPGPDNEIVLERILAGQLKLSLKVKKLLEDALRDECSKNNLGLADPQTNPKGIPITIILTNRDLEVNESVFQGSPLDNCLVIEKHNLELYYGCFTTSNMFLQFGKLLINFATPQQIMNSIPGVKDVKFLANIQPKLPFKSLEAVQRVLPTLFAKEPLKFDDLMIDIFPYGDD